MQKNKLIVAIFLILLVNLKCYTQETLGKDQISKFIKVVCQDDYNPSVDDYLMFFGEHSEVEIQFLLQRCHSKDISKDSCVRISNSMYAAPEDYQSLTFKHLKSYFNRSCHIMEISLVKKDQHKYFFKVKLRDHSNDEKKFIFILYDKGEGLFIMDILNEKKQSILL